MSQSDQAEGPAGAARTFKHGDFLLTVVSDGYISVPDDVVTAGADPAARAAQFSSAFRPQPGE